MSPRLTCTNHCSQCGRHFHSLHAFDAHHIHDETGWSVCLDPLDLEDRDGKPRLVALGVGVCNIYPPYSREATIWTTADYKRARVLRNAPETRDRATRGAGDPVGGVS
jgi:hypothetical protein